MEKTKTVLPWAQIVSYLPPKELSAVRLVNKSLCDASSPLFVPELHADEIYAKFMQALLDKKVTNSVCRKD